MKWFRSSGRWVMGLAGVMAICVASFMNTATWAQRPVIDPLLPDRPGFERTLPEKTGPEVAPAKRDFGDVSVAFRNLARHALPSIVSIDAMTRPVKRCEGPLWRHMVGSGFVVDPAGMILTSSQLVFGADRVKVRLRDGSELFASSVRMDPRSNVAVVEISPIANLPALPMGDSDAMQVGDWVLALGRSSRLLPTAAQGIINAVVPGPSIARNEDFFKTDVALQPGSAGGPILNLNGQVIGITTAVSNWDEELDRMGLAVPSNLARWSSRQLIDNGMVNRGYLGVGTQPMSARLARQFNVPLGQGALVNRVIPNTSAADAKFLPGDVITKVNGQPVVDTRHLQVVTEHLQIGKSYPVEIIRNGDRMTLNFTAGKMPDQLNLTPRPQRLDAPPVIKANPSSFGDLGLGVKEPTAEQLRQAGYPDTIHGVMIDSISPDSPAAAVGLQPGMVIEKVGQRDIRSVTDFKATETDIAVNNGVLLYIHTRQGPKFVAVGPDEF